MLPNRYIYPAYFFFDEDGVSIEFPDLPGCLPCAETAEQAFDRAREALGLHLFGMEQDGDPIPEPTPIAALPPRDQAVPALIEVFMPALRDKASHRMVKKTLTIPAWLNSEAEAAHVNFSQVLQDGLKAYLHS